MPDAEAKALLCKAADDFVYENILLAAKQVISRIFHEIQ